MSDSHRVKVSNAPSNQLQHNALSSTIAKALSSRTGVEVHFLIPVSQTLSSGDVGSNDYIVVDLSSVQSIRDALATITPKPDILISAHHGGDFDLQSRIVKATIQANIPRFMPSEFTHDSMNQIVQERLPPHKERARLLETLRHQSSIEWVGLATGYPLDQRLKDGHMGADLTWQSATVYGSGDELFAASSLDFVGEVVAVIVTHWNEVTNRYLCLAGIMTSSKEVLRELEAQMGREWTAVYVEKEKCIEEADRRMQGGWPDAGMFLMERSLLSESTVFQRFEGDRQLMGQLVLSEQSIREMVAHIIHSHQHSGKADCGC